MTEPRRVPFHRVRHGTVTVEVDQYLTAAQMEDLAAYVLHNAVPGEPAVLTDFNMRKDPSTDGAFVLMLGWKIPERHEG